MSSPPIKRPMRLEYLYFDQYGNGILARTMAELLAKAEGSTIRHYYGEGVDGRSVQLGFIVRRNGESHYFTRYQQVAFPKR